MDLLTSQETLLEAARLIKQTTGQFIVRPEGVAGGPGIAGFEFDIIGSEEMQLESDITDHFVENNVAIQDHIALHSEIFILKGYVGEVADVAPRGLIALLAQAAQLETVAEYYPEFTVGALQAYLAIEEATRNAESVVNQAQSLYELYSQQGTSYSKQQNAYNFFSAMRLSRQLCTIQTPWQVYEAMAIQSVRPVQNEDTQIITDFTVTFKRIRTAESVSVFQVPAALGRAQDMISAVSEKGRSVGIPVSAAQLSIDFGPKS